jgi:hypothetical protein
VEPSRAGHALDEERAADLRYVHFDACGHAQALGSDVLGMSVGESRLPRRISSGEVSTEYEV